MSEPSRAQAYERHTGRYGPELAAAFIGFAGRRSAFELIHEMHADGVFELGEEALFVVARKPAG